MRDNCNYHDYDYDEHDRCNYFCFLFSSKSKPALPDFNLVGTAVQLSSNVSFLHADLFI